MFLSSFSSSFFSSLFPSTTNRYNIRNDYCQHGRLPGTSYSFLFVVDCYYYTYVSSFFSNTTGLAGMHFFVTLFISMCNSGNTNLTTFSTFPPFFYSLYRNMSLTRLCGDSNTAKGTLHKRGWICCILF